MDGYILTRYGWKRSDAKPIPNWPGYLVTKDGRVYGKHGKLIGHQRTEYVHLSRDGKSHRRLIARLILEAFVGPCPDGYVLEYKIGRNRYELKDICWTKKI